jgi:hypothetical protein
MKVKCVFLCGWGSGWESIIRIYIDFEEVGAETRTGRVARGKSSRASIIALKQDQKREDVEKEFSEIDGGVLVGGLAVRNTLMGREH